MIIAGPCARLSARLQLLLDNDLSDNTDKTRATQKKNYLEFCAVYGIDPYGPGREGIAFYIAHLSNTHRYVSIKNYVCGVNYFLGSYRVTDVPYDDPLIIRALRGARRFLGDYATQALALLPEHLLVMYDVLPVSLGHSCFWAAALFAFRSLMRKCHYTDGESVLCRSAFQFYDWGMMVTVTRTKTIQFKERKLMIPICRVSNKTLCAVYWVERHFAEVKAKPSHPAFMIPDGENVSPMSYSLFSKILKLLAERAGIQAERVSSHGFRSGGATFLARLGVDLDVIKGRGDWKSDQVLVYLRRPVQDRIALDHKVAGMLSKVIMTE